ENLAEGFFDNSQAMVAWMNSPTHRDNILRADFTEVGFGIVQGDFQNIPNNIIIVVHFGTPQPAFQQAQISGSNDQVLEAPEILYPLPGSVVSSADFDVSGLAPNASLVNLYDHGGLLGSAAVDEGIFTYRANNFVDGEHSLHAVSEIGTWESGPSAPVGFMVDTQADPITADQILVISNDNGNLIIQINAPSLQEVTIMLNGHQYKFAAITSNIWQAEIPLIELQATAKFFISNLDKGDHEWNGELSTSSLLEQAEFVPSFAPGLRGVSGGWDFNVSRAGVNAAFLIILCVLFGLDFTILSKTGLTSHNRSRTHLHFAALVIILLVTMGTSLAGNIGPSGLTSF
ncbi:hypothetical protein KC640_03750, partial [Candidatus Dojkabacteria bacterium]|nr:hypothetical protein [Candidatus Dojkabacteria bacterium]